MGKQARPITKQHNCYLAADTKTGNVLASVECGYSQKDRAIVLFGFNKIFRERKCIGADGKTYRRLRETVHDFLIANWAQWVPMPWVKWYALEIGGGSYWPLKLLRPGEWNDDSLGFYSFENKRRRDT